MEKGWAIMLATKFDDQRLQYNQFYYGSNGNGMVEYDLSILYETYATAELLNVVGSCYFSEPIDMI